ncbi:hypothetical protein PR048_006898 [Dryococelus australis]|uniref:Uncharacterized protein n=1 Tax=Dryococelus australis TaxID=614101 RepID=A0ABQ9IC87_9NEOP|nr:hypothetical protein PR048_006898 [Dryococelus australis]
MFTDNDGIRMMNHYDNDHMQFMQDDTMKEDIKIFVFVYWRPENDYDETVNANGGMGDLRGMIKPACVECTLARHSQEVNELQNEQLSALNTGDGHVTPTKKRKPDIEDETGGEDCHEDSIDDNDYGDSVNEVSDEEDDSLDVRTHFTNEFPSTSGAKKVEGVKLTGSRSKVKFRDIQHWGLYGRRPTGKTEHERHLVLVPRPTLEEKHCTLARAGSERLYSKTRLGKVNDAAGIAERRMEGARVCEAELVASSSHQTALGHARSTAIETFPHVGPRWLSGQPARLQSKRNGFYTQPCHSRIFANWESCRTMPLVGGFSREFPRREYLRRVDAQCIVDKKVIKRLSKLLREVGTGTIRAFAWNESRETTINRTQDGWSGIRTQVLSSAESEGSPQLHLRSVVRVRNCTVQAFSVSLCNYGNSREISWEFARRRLTSSPTLAEVDCSRVALRKQPSRKKKSPSKHKPRYGPVRRRYNVVVFPVNFITLAEKMSIRVSIPHLRDASVCFITGAEDPDVNVVRTSAYSPSTNSIPGGIAPGSSQVGILPGRCRWSATFLGVIQFPLALAFRRCSVLTSFHHQQLSRPRCLGPLKSLRSLTRPTRSCMSEQLSPPVMTSLSTRRLAFEKKKKSAFRRDCNAVRSPARRTPWYRLFTRGGPVQLAILRSRTSPGGTPCSDHSNGPASNIPSRRVPGMSNEHSAVSEVHVTRPPPAPRTTPPPIRNKIVARTHHVPRPTGRDSRMVFHDYLTYRLQNRSVVSLSIEVDGEAEKGVHKLHLRRQHAYIVDTRDDSGSLIVVKTRRGVSFGTNAVKKGYVPLES